MAKYMVYLKEGKGIFIVKADTIYEDEGKVEFYISKNDCAVAMFRSELVYAIIDAGKAERVDINDGIRLKSDDVKGFVDGVFGKGVLPC